MAASGGRGDAVLEPVHAEALFLQLDEAEAAFLLLETRMRSLLQVLLM
jgi:hypothetical protein